ncbi:leucine-rich repeat domain-containing protein [Cellulophaga tyrosinoxydans]|uniref:Leucine-rich repeat domain-containing protein n=1 Tax=Cellulophaga tyrosinoxydans TaxID=504486 RepID=A0A1W2C1E5_9FLAO|nr:hypothetical protein [Cellulophaga tyrosinoxydans]SMC78558.1 hypothetical protein SAMN05660703_2734 [Cellulophaga tyrosinoxydans]
MKPEIIDGIKFQIGIDGSKTLLIESDRLNECINYVLEGHAKSIFINYFQGYLLPEIDFLSKLSDVLEGLHLPESKFNIEVVNSLHKLKYLGIADNKIDNLNLSNFPNMVSLACEYSPRLKNLESCKNLTNLTITGYKPRSKDLEELSVHTKLEELHLFKPDILNLKGIENCTQLKKIEIFSARNLTILNALTPLNNLNSLELFQCKNIQDFDQLGNLKNIKKIILSECGEIKNLKFLKELKELEFFSFWDTTVLDGNLNYCNGIKFVGFKDKREYTHKVNDFKNK